MLLLYPCRQFFQEQYQALDAELFSPNRSAFPAQAFNADSFAWAVATVRSKLHAPLDTDNIALVPLADAVSACRSLVKGVEETKGLLVQCPGLWQQWQRRASVWQGLGLRCGPGGKGSSNA